MFLKKSYLASDHGSLPMGFGVARMGKYIFDALLSGLHVACKAYLTGGVCTYHHTVTA